MCQTMPSLTLTGADEQTDIDCLKTIRAEIGFLYTETPEGRNRYPRAGWIAEASSEVPRAALHLCGKRARHRLLLGELDRMVASVERIQLNGNVPWEDLAVACLMYPEHTLIIQDRYDRPEIHSEIGLEAFDNWAVLHDDSGGRGILPSRWRLPTLRRACGFAGGLNYANLPEQLRSISWLLQEQQYTRTWWVDMESSLRTAGDWFCLEEAQRCVEAFEREVFIYPE